MKRVICLVFLAAIAFFSCFGKTSDVKIDYGSSTLFTAEDMDSAISVIKRSFVSFMGCELHSLTYAGDDVCRDELFYHNKFMDGPEFSECIVFRSSFRSPKNGGTTWEADHEYTWSWILGRADGKSWKLFSYGYA